jgi:hypothetical protein
MGTAGEVMDSAELYVGGLLRSRPWFNLIEFRATLGGDESDVFANEGGGVGAPANLVGSPIREFQWVFR